MIVRDIKAFVIVEMAFDGIKAHTGNSSFLHTRVKKQNKR